MGDITIPRAAAELAYRAVRQRWAWYTKHGHAIPRELDETLRSLARAIGAEQPPQPFYGLSDRPWK